MALVLREQLEDDANLGVAELDVLRRLN